MNTLELRASALVNPASGVANDYLNHFNEILLLIENLPALLPEMVDELLGWKPVSYRGYFERSPLPAARRSGVSRSADKACPIVRTSSASRRSRPATDRSSSTS